MTEETKVRLMVIPIVAMLAVTMIVAGWQQEEEQVEIEVEEHPSELTLEKHLQPPESSTGGGQRVISNLSSTSTTYVDNQGHLEFEVAPISIKNVETGYQRQTIEIELQVQGVFEEDLNIGTLKTRVVEDEEREPRFPTANFMMPYWEFNGVEAWSQNEHKLGGSLTGPENPVYVGHDIDSNEFTVEHRLSITRPLENIGENLTLEFQAVVDGNISEEVVSTVHFNVEGVDES